MQTVPVPYDGYAPRSTGSILDEVVRLLSGNLKILETGNAPDGFRSSYGGQESQVEERVVFGDNTVSGTECDHCKAAAGTSGEAKVTLKMCDKCHRAWYCSRECQVAAWKAHKQLCKKKYDFREGDAATLCDLVAQPQRNGLMVLVQGRDEERCSEDPALQRWKVLPIGEGKPISVAAKNLSRCRL